MVKRVTSRDPDFRGLVQLLDRYLAEIDGDEHDFYDQFNTVNSLKHCAVYYENGIPLGCGALKQLDECSFEIKRMFVHPSARGKGIASEVVVYLESWACEMGGKQILLETGKRMPDAIGLYKKLGYSLTANYGQYKGIKNSQCFEKCLSS